ncbi:MAG: DUF3048 domain-containing protein [Anaerolineae bacterium]|nr:DUF3048 domain-containing protein [Anaerolineae bacterium]
MVLKKWGAMLGALMLLPVLLFLRLDGAVQANNLSAQITPTVIVPNTTTGPSLSDSATLTGLYGFSPEINPLTGLPVADPSLLNRRPVLIKVSNYPRYSRPQAGLTYADMVFEYYIGEEANRFLALFYGQNINKIGPVRSGRLIDSQLTNMYGGILAYGNADPKVDNVLIYELDQRAIAFNDAGCPSICGKDTHSVAGVFADSAELTAYTERHQIDNNRPDLTGMLFDKKTPDTDLYGVKINVRYSIRDIGEWRYDPATGKYLRWIEAQGTGKPEDLIPLTDRLNGQQISFANIIIVFTRYIEYAPTLHQIEIWNNQQGQPAIIFRDGVAVKGEWSTPGHTAPIRFYDQSGLPLALKPGNTWIVVAGFSSTLEQKQTGDWALRFALP